MSKIITYDQVFTFFENENYLLLSKEYISASNKLDYKCPNGHIHSISWSQFRRGERCPFCSKKIKYTYEYVKQCFEDYGCKLLETEYINCKTLMKYICNCGNKSEIKFYKFLQGQRCMKCSYKKKGESKKHTYQYVYNYFKEYGCELLEDNYIHSQVKMKYKCVCGNMSTINFDNFKNNNVRCKKCGYDKNANNRRHSYEYVYNFFKENNCELLEDNYINNSTDMKYKCECGNIDYISFLRLRVGQRCSNCAESKGEKAIRKYLLDNNINFKQEYRFSDCKDKRSLPFDFAIFNDNNQLYCLIEYDGQQHYIANDYFGGEKALKQTQKRDQIKTKYCFDNNIKLIRISYLKFDNIKKILNKKIKLNKSPNKVVNFVDV